MAEGPAFEEDLDDLRGVSDDEALPIRTAREASARSCSTRRRALSRSPAAMAWATTGKVTVQIMRESTIGICATFCA